MLSIQVRVLSGHHFLHGSTLLVNADIMSSWSCDIWWLQLPVGAKPKEHKHIRNGCNHSMMTLHRLVITMIHTWNNMEEDVIRNKLQALSFCLAGVCLIPAPPKETSTLTIPKPPCSSFDSRSIYSECVPRRRHRQYFLLMAHYL